MIKRLMTNSSFKFMTTCLTNRMDSTQGERLSVNSATKDTDRLILVISELEKLVQTLKRDAQRLL